MLLQPPLSTTEENFRPKRNARIMPPSAWLLAWALLLLHAGLARAQCAHNPTVTPNNLIFCPNSGSDTLWTQPYQAYQWFKDGVLQPGDTLRYRRVTSADAGSMFSVDATLNGCTERSPQVMVDGWIFLLPTVMTVGLQNPLCRGDTLLLILMAPYKVNIQWTNGGLPIPGANDDTLIVTTDGDYSVSGAPEICPGFIQQLGVIMSYRFLPCGASSDPDNQGSTLYPSLSKKSFYAYPNPSTGPTIYLRGNPEYEAGILELYDSKGQELSKQLIQPGTLSDSMLGTEPSKNLSSGIQVVFPQTLENGLYTLLWRSESVISSIRWLLSH